MQTYVLLAILASVCYGVSVVFQKKGIERISGKKIKWFKKYSINWKFVKKILNKYFLSGIGIGFIGSLIYLKAMSVGEVSIILPLTHISILVTWVLSISYLKEKVGSREWLALVLIFLGALLLSVTA
jgi:uncharacterized membrane protein